VNEVYEIFTQCVHDQIWWREHSKTKEQIAEMDRQTLLKYSRRVDRYVADYDKVKQELSGQLTAKPELANLDFIKFTESGGDIYLWPEIEAALCNIRALLNALESEQGKKLTGVEQVLPLCKPVMQPPKTEQTR
jgi:hypothetical protein